MELDALSLCIAEEINAEQVSSFSAAWEHEQLAQVKVRVLRGHDAGVKTCQFCANDTRVLTGSEDNALFVWDCHSGKHLQTYHGHSAQVSQARANSDSTRFVSVGWDKRVLLWDAETARVLWTGYHGGIVTCCNFSKSGKLVVTGSDIDCSVRIWDVHTGRLVQELKDHHVRTITSCQFNPSESRIFTTSMDRTVKAWDMKTNITTLTLTEHGNVVSDACCTDSEHSLATVSWDKSIKIWDISTGEYRSQGCRTINKAHEGCISCCQFSNDGGVLVTGGYDNQVLVWDVDSLLMKLRLQGHTGWVEDVSITEDKKNIVSASLDGTVRVWNVENPELIPMVMETKRAIGLKLFSCCQCDKTFSAMQLDDDAAKLCVFCRLHASECDCQKVQASL